MDLYAVSHDSECFPVTRLYSHWHAFVYEIYVCLLKTVVGGRQQWIAAVSHDSESTRDKKYVLRSQLAARYLQDSW